MTQQNLPFSQTRLFHRLLVLAAIMIVVLLLAGCAQTGQMARQPRYNPLSASELFSNGQSAQNFPPGTVSYLPTASPNDPLLTAQDPSGQPYKGFPMPVDQALIQFGKERYDIYCVPCHGKGGAGDGTVVSFGFPKPPCLVDANAQSLTNADIFYVIADGKGKMFSYGYRVKPYDRWAVIAYIRAMQLTNGAVSPQDLTQDQINQIGSKP